MISPSTKAPTRASGVGQEMSLLTEGVERYCADYLLLAKMEIGAGAASMARDLGLLGLFTMLIGTGYALLCAALALALAPSLGAAWAFLAVGASSAIAGAIGIKLVVDRMRASSRRLLPPSPLETTS